MSLTEKSFFDALAASVCTPVDGAERVTLYLKAETSDFIRFNRAAVRQATHVRQGHATLAVVNGSRRIETTLALTGRADEDGAALHAERAVLLAQLPDVPEDPYLLLSDEVSASYRHETGTLPTAEALVAAVTAAARGLDFVGFYAGGPMVRAFADSRGQRHWHHVESFHIDWCLYHAADKAVKASYAGTQWVDAEFARRVAAGAERLPLLALPPRHLAPGAYRAYFTPAAMGELVGMLGWGGFGAQARRTGTSSLCRLEHRDASLNAAVHLSEDTAHCIAPAFTAEGFAKPARVLLVEAGRATGTLNSPRSAQQYGLEANGANPEETPESLHLAPGTLPEADALAALDTGLYVSNLWYLNYSDRQACRMTGMTRFACFWVEDGRLVAPLSVMRFDDSFLRMFGEGLIALTDRSEMIPESGTYQERQLSSLTTPGAVMDGWRLTL
ncbi:TldD/PmbA family protein [Piscinibacter sp.]|uniref:TldD/PmbA family protein n=1 Tax=Piscinibacter sp. TaxID=1903157 RepID=UPI002BE445BC|nr:metallopeptidase TldD-related protein [Albitalea sp.]HUG21739.1 metallopeptidase TldD-related protein [Albitalea sp.]